jgi:hypothetical protein
MVSTKGLRTPAAAFLGKHMHNPKTSCVMANKELVELLLNFFYALLTFI